MNNTHRGSWIHAAAVVAAVTMFQPLGACSSDGTQAAAGSPGSGGSKADGGGGSLEGGNPDASKEGGGNDPFYNAAFAGIDTSIVPSGNAPAGCKDGLDQVTGRITITLDAQNSVLLLGVVGTEIRANGVTCTAPGGTPATRDNTSSIWVNGTDGGESVIIDLSTGTFGSKLFSKDGGLHVDLKGGKDTLSIRATDQNDILRVGKVNGETTIDVTSDSSGDIWVAGVRKLVFSLGPGMDDFRAGSDANLESPPDLPLVVFGDADNDVIEGGRGDDELNGGDGDDVFDEGEPNNGSDLINGGLDKKNTVTYERRTGDTTFTLCTSTDAFGCSATGCSCLADDGSAQEKDNIINVHHFIGGSGGDNVTATELDDVIDGRDGADYLYGMAGDDKLLGGPGEDTLEGGPGADDLDCGGGDSDIAVKDAFDTVVNCELY